MTDELYEKASTAFEKTAEDYNKIVFELPKPRTQEVLNKVHADFVVKRDAAFAELGTTYDEWDRKLNERLKAKYGF